MGAEAGVAYVRAERRSDEEATGTTSLAGDRTTTRVACEPEARLSLAKERVRDAADMLYASSVCVRRVNE